MKTFIFLFLFLGSGSVFADLSWEYSASEAQMAGLDQAGPLKVFWWNTACGNVEDQIKRKLKQPGALYKNIEAIASLPAAPDILILGEHCPGHIPKATQALLKKKYKFNFEQSSSNPNGKIRNGIWVFSKWKISLMKKEKMITGSTAQEQKDTSRTYLLLKVQRPHGEFYLSPVHLYNPWRKIGISEALGTDNVNYKQAELTLGYLKRDLGDSASPLIVIGDFNAAKGFWGVDMPGFSLMADELHDVGTSEVTFPTESAKKLGNGFPGVTIDHIFTNIETEVEGMMLPLQGSDHYPVLLLVK